MKQIKKQIKRLKKQERNYTTNINDSFILKSIFNISYNICEVYFKI